MCRAPLPAWVPACVQGHTTYLACAACCTSSNETKSYIQNRHCDPTRGDVLAVYRCSLLPGSLTCCGELAEDFAAARVIRCRQRGTFDCEIWPSDGMHIDEVSPLWSCARAGMLGKEHRCHRCMHTGLLLHDSVDLVL